MGYKYNNSISSEKVLNRAIPSRKFFESTTEPFGKFYAGIGSRNAPEDIKKIAIKLGYYLALEGYILRSGGAEGMDDFFETGADLAKIFNSNVQKQIFLPEKNTWSNPSIWHTIPEVAYKTVDIYHKYGKNIKGFTRKLMARNSMQVLGPNLDKKSLFLVCWTPDGCIKDQDRTYTKGIGTGGTGQAISIAEKNNVPIFNLKVTEHLNKILKKIEFWEKKHGECPDYNILLNYDIQKKYKLK